MNALVGLGAITVILGFGAGPLLDRAWCLRLPRVAAAAWLGVLSGVVTGAFGMVAVVLTASHGLAHRAVEWTAHCWHHHHGPAGAASRALDVALLAATVAAACGAALRYRRTLAGRRRHLAALRLVARAGDADDVCVVEHPVPVVYCVPARARPIVVSSGALERLQDAQLHAALAHERAHLRHRHHLILTTVDALAYPLGRLPAFRLARRGLPLLLEMAADEAAARTWGREAVAALRRLAIRPAPPGCLAASGPAHLERRLARLEAAPVAEHRRLTWFTAAISVAVPLLISAGWLTATPLAC
jgi:hypothetical protein